MQPRSKVQFRVLGRLELERNGVVVTPTSPTQRTLLAALLIHANVPVASDVLVDATWEGRPPAGARDSLWVHVSQIRKRLQPDPADAGEPPVQITVGGGYLLRLEPAQVDSHRFEETARVGVALLRSGDYERSFAALSTALELWRGPPYEDVRYRDFAQPEIRRLEEVHDEVVEHRIDAALALARDEELLPELFELVDSHPYRERFWAQLMLALYRSGRQADALDTYKAARRRLDEELGLEPGPELRRLEHRILRQDSDLELAARPEVRLPEPLTSFVGRVVEIQDVRALLERNRLVTLVGAGGSGKTRLAIQAARATASDESIAVWFVDMSGVKDAEDPAGAILHAVGVAGEAERSETEVLADFVGSRRALLVLDGCEHVVARVADFASRLTPRCRDLRLLVTSRERLGVPGEAMYQVPPMSLPEAELDEIEVADAVQLFVARAREVVPDFQLRGSARDVAAIVRMVGGMPLAIEIAAVRLDALSVGDLAARLGDAFPWLLDSPRAALPRHRTLRAALDWSYRLLSPDERVLFRRLWVFRGGWTLGALEAVCDDSGARPEDLVERLVRLVEKSMVQVARNGAEVRYSLLEPVRQYALSLPRDAKEETELRMRHAAFYAALASALQPILKVGVVSARRTFEVEEPNMVAALQWLLTDDPLAATSLAIDLTGFWGYVGRYDRTRYWLDRVLGGRAKAPAELAKLLIFAAWNATLEGDFEHARRLLDAAAEPVRAADDRTVEAYFVNQLGMERALRGDVRAAEPLVRDACELWRSGPGERTYVPLHNLAVVLAWRGKTAESAEFARHALESARREGDDVAAATARIALGMAFLYAGEWDRAADQLDAGTPAVAAGGIHAIHGFALTLRGAAALAMGDAALADRLCDEAARLVEHPPANSIALFARELRARIALARGDIHRAWTVAETSLHLAEDADNAGAVARLLDVSALVEHRRGMLDRAALLLRAASDARERLGLARTAHESTEAAELASSLLRHLGEHRWRELDAPKPGGLVGRRTGLARLKGRSAEHGALPRRADSASNRAPRGVVGSEGFHHASELEESPDA